jgi:hypothetical protein
MTNDTMTNDQLKQSEINIFNYPLVIALARLRRAEGPLSVVEGESLGIGHYLTS